MKKSTSIFLGIFTFIFFITLFSILMYILVKTGKEERKELYIKSKRFEKEYDSYNFEGEVIDIFRSGRIYWLLIKTKNDVSSVDDCCNYLVSNGKHLLQVSFNDMLTFPNYHIKFKKGGLVYKKKGSSAIFYKFGGKTYILSDIYCKDFSVTGFYSVKEEQYPCDSTIHKVTNDGYWWYIIRDTVK